MSRIGVVTVTYNSLSVLAEFLDSVWKQTHSDFLLFVIDSGSTDGTQEYVRNVGDPRMRRVFFDENIGFAAGSNRGIKMALEENCDSIMLLNNDTVLGPDLFQQLSAGLETCACDMTTPKMLYHDGSNKIWAAGGHLNRWLAYRNIHDGANHLDNGAFDRPRRVTFTPFCCVMMRSAVVERLGYLDENYFVYTEDADYCFRAHRANLSLWYLPKATLWHKVSSLTGGAETPFLIRYCTRNRIYFLQKNLGGTRAQIWTAAYKIYYCLRWLTGTDTREMWRAKRQAVVDGIRMHRGQDCLRIDS